MEELLKNLIRRLDEIDRKLELIEEKMAQAELISNVQEESELYEEAKQIAAETGGLNVPLLENRLNIGHSHAEKLLDKLEANGIIDPCYGNEDIETISN